MRAKLPPPRACGRPSGCVRTAGWASWTSWRPSEAPATTVQTIHQSTNGDMAKAGHEDVLTSGTISDWHTYAVNREPGSVKWYVDGRLVFSKTVSNLMWLDTRSTAR